MWTRSASIMCAALAVMAVGTADPARAAESTIQPDTTSVATDVGDLWRLLRRKAIDLDAGNDPDAKRRFLVFAPTIGSKPSTGLSGGFSGNMAFFSGDPATTHISSMTGGFKVTENKQLVTGLRLSMFSDADRWFIQGDLRLSLTSQNTYGFGTDSPSANAVKADYTQQRAYESVYRRIAPHLYVGGGLNVSDHSNIRPGGSVLTSWNNSAYVSYSEKHGFNLDGQTSAGTSVSLLYDTRDNAINARRGSFVNTTYRTFFDGFLGGDSSWQELSVDMRTYKSLSRSGRQKLAFWFQQDAVTGGTAPYLDLPATAANDRSARGYSEGRYRGEQLLYGEMEYRGSLVKSGLLGFVAFVNTTTVSSRETGERLFDSFAPGAGFGMRVLLNKRSRTNLCTDYGWGKQGSRGFYLAIQEAF
jgi:outer membrane protein assembly factor BamA